MSGIEEVLNKSILNQSQLKVPLMIHYSFRKEDNTSFLEETIRKGLKKMVAYEPGIEKISKQRR